MDNCTIGRRARIRRAILDENVVVPDDATIGFDSPSDQALYHVTESGILDSSPGRSQPEKFWSAITFFVNKIYYYFVLGRFSFDT